MIRIERNGTVRVLVIDNPPVNALGIAARRAIADAVHDAMADDTVDCVVIAGAGRLFSGGADITEFDAPPQSPWLPELLEMIEQSPKPVVAALHGSALGGGLELPLACHYRVAAPSARLGLPEVKIGLLPGAGGTQRLPRLVGIADALAMIVSGEPIDAARAHAIGLVDRVVGEDTLLEDAIAFAHAVAVPNGPRRTGALPVTDAPGVIDAFVDNNAKRMRGLDAPAACVAAIRDAASLPFAEGMARENAAFLSLTQGRQSRALRHLFFAERAAARIDGLPRDQATLPIAQVGIVGAGTMGGGIAMVFLSAGLPVVLVEREQAALDRGVATLRATFERSVRNNRLTVSQVDAAMALLSPTLDFDALAGCDLVIEAVFETLEIKQAVFRTLDAIAKPGAILATNTSFLDVDAIASVTGRPDHVLGLHFFSPANVMRLLEVVRGARTAPAVLATALALAKRLRKTAVVAGNCHGFIGNRILAPRQRQAEQLALEGAAPEQIDRVLLDLGLPMGPFAMADLAGLDLGWSRTTSTGSAMRDAMCAADRRGQKNGRGFYDYDETRARTASADAVALIAALAARQGVPQRVPDEFEIRERLLFVMVNEAAKILDEGIAQRPSDIDVVWCLGYGWPAHTGGPLFWADGIGLHAVIAGLERHANRLGEDAAISPLLRARAEAGGFYASC